MPVGFALTFSLARAAAVSASHSVPASWQGTDVGAVGLPGSANQGRDGDLFINGAGGDIWGTSDSFHVVYQAFLDGEIEC